MAYGIEQAYRNLAMSIVTKAIADYKSVLKRCRAQRNERYGYVDPRTMAERMELEDFFDSSWCDQLTGFDGSDIKNYVKNRIYKEADGCGL